MKVDRKDLLARCETVKPAIRTSSSMPSLSFLWFRGGYVYGYDGGMGIACALPAGIDFEGGVIGSTLLAMLDSSTKETIDLNPSEDGFDLKIGGSRAKLASTSVDRFFWNFPVKAPDGEPILKLSKEVLSAIKAVMPVKHDAPRIPEHHGIVMYSDGGEVSFLTTDTFAIAAFRVEEAFPKGQCILPRVFAQQVIKHGKEGQPIWSGDGSLSLFAGQTPGQIQIHTNSLDTDEIKDLTRVVSQHSRDAGNGIKIPEGFAEALSRAEIMAHKDQAIIEIQCSDDSIGIRGKYGDGHFHESLEVEDGANLFDRIIRVDSTLLKRGLPLATHIAVGETSILLYGEEGKYSYLLAAVD